MRIPRHNPSIDGSGCDFVYGLLEQSLASGKFAVPLLPESAVRIVRTRESANAKQLSDIVKADPALTMYVLRIAASAPERPAMPIVSLAHAVAWLGFDEVANIAFTLALQSRMLHVPGHQRQARRLWRHSLASALWSRQLALMSARDNGLCYLCGLLHDIGKAVTLVAANDFAMQSGKTLSNQDYDRLVETFHRDVAASVVTAWDLPAPIFAVVNRWDAYADAGGARFECNIVNVARRLADYTVQGALPARASFIVDPSFRDLGLSSDDAAPLFDFAPDISAELDRYLSP
jgi:HD-like signal output (HDOD) protein